ncbi:MAG TPA: DUF2125 domain-containing protein [Acidisphaera sp.]|nr:DUF2125 domain-containing protein [Acidisphaera sp.]
MKRVSTALLLIFAVALVGEFAYWRVAVDRLQTGFDDWAAARTRAGWTIRAGKPVAGGWPLSATLTMPDVTLSATGATLPVGVSWHADKASLSVDLFSPTHLRIEPDGAQSLRFGDGPAIPYEADRLTVSVPLNEPGPTSEVEVRGSGIEGKKGADADATGFGVELLSAHLRATADANAKEPAFAAVIAAESVSVRPDAVAPLGAAFGDRMPSVVIEALLTGPVPPPGDPAQRARQWRDAGGRLDITRIVLGWGTLALHGRGSMTLDAGLQPSGSGDAQVVDYSAAIDSLTRAHVIGAGAALSARAVLSVVSQASDNSDIRSADVPVTLKDGILMLDRFPLVRVPALNLP